MAHNIIERPHAFCMSKNEIRYVYQLTNLNRAGLFLEVKLFYDKGNGAIQIGDSFKLKPDTAGYVYFYCNAYIDSVLTYQMPDLSTFKTAAFSQYARIWVSTREVDDANTDVWNDHEETKKRLAFKMGVEKHFYSRNNVFNYINTYKPPMTWHATNRYVFASQPNVITFFNKEGQFDDKTMEVKYFSVDDITNELTTTISLQGIDTYLIHFNLLPNFLGISLTAGKLYKFSVAIYNATGTYYLDPFTFFIDYRPFYQYWDLLYFNALGGVDSLRITGEQNETLDINQIDGDGGFSYNEWNALNKTPDFTAYSTFTRKFKGDIGFTDTKKEQLVKAELFVSPLIYMIVDGRSVRVSSINRSVDLGKKIEDISSLPIEWQLAEENDVYTPDFAKLGAGNDIETYP